MLPYSFAPPLLPPLDLKPGQASYGGAASDPSHSSSSSSSSATAAGSGSRAEGGDGTAAQHQHDSGGESTPTFPGAPERDQWSGGTPGSTTTGGGEPGKFEEELAREERELFGDKSSKRSEMNTGTIDKPLYRGVFLCLFFRADAPDEAPVAALHNSRLDEDEVTS